MCIMKKLGVNFKVLPPKWAYLLISLSCELFKIPSCIYRLVTIEDFLGDWRAYTYHGLFSGDSFSNTAYADTVQQKCLMYFPLPTSSQARITIWFHILHQKSAGWPWANHIKFQLFWKELAFSFSTETDPQFLCHRGIAPYTWQIPKQCIQHVFWPPSCLWDKKKMT